MLRLPAECLLGVSAGGGLVCCEDRAEGAEDLLRDCLDRAGDAEPAARRGDRRGAAGSQPARGGRRRLERASSAMGPMNRELGPRLKPAVAASAELQERDELRAATVSLG